MALNSQTGPESRAALRQRLDPSLRWQDGRLKVRGADAKDLVARMTALGLIQPAKPRNYKSPEQIAAYRKYRRYYQTACMASCRAQRRGLLARRTIPRKLLRQAATGLWLTPAGFSPEIGEAMPFKSFTAALAHVAGAKLEGLELFVVFAHGRYDRAFPLAVLRAV